MLVRLVFGVCSLIQLVYSSHGPMHPYGPLGSVCWQMHRHSEPLGLRGTMGRGEVSPLFRDMMSGSYEVMSYCCKGYKDILGSCRAVCEPECVHGTCVRPGECVCDKGYVPHLKPYECVPLCSKICVFGNCTAPETCTCYSGYELELDEHTCSPVCSKPCFNGRCVAPERCECDPGYELSEDGLACNPFCTSLCTFGTCTYPETCTCNDGYELNQSGNICAPVCKSFCKNGWCDKPNVCGCFQGYILNETSHECVPVCERPCVNGDCIAPDECDCHDNFFKSKHDAFTCESQCKEPCVFGTCTAPDTCTCIDGYQKSPNLDTLCVPTCQGDCGYGFCVAPDTCQCHEGYVKPISDGPCACEVECVHGNCTKHGCLCNFGWEGEICDKPLLCSIKKPQRVVKDDARAERDVIDLEQKGKFITPVNDILKWDGPICHPECLSNAKDLDAHPKNAMKRDFYLLPIDTTCNTIEVRVSYSGTHSSYGGAIAGVVVGWLIIVLTILIGIRIYQKRRVFMHRGAERLLYVPENDDQDTRVP